MSGKVSGQRDQCPDGQRVDDPCHRGFPACVDVGGGAGDRSGGGDAAEQGGANVGRALRQKLCAVAVLAADHPVGHHSRKQRFNPGEESDGERGGQKLQHQCRIGAGQLRPVDAAG